MLEVEGDRHVPLATVGEDIAQEELDEATIEFLGRCRRDDVGEEEVGAFELVPEQDVVLRELEVFEAHALPGGRPQEVQGGEEPAASGLLLGRHLPVIHLVRNDRRRGDDLVAVEGDRLNAGVSDRVASDRARAVGGGVHAGNELVRDLVCHERGVSFLSRVILCKDTTRQ